VIIAANFGVFRINTKKHIAISFTNGDGFKYGLVLEVWLMIF